MGSVRGVSGCGSGLLAVVLLCTAHWALGRPAQAAASDTALSGCPSVEQSLARWSAAESWVLRKVRLGQLANLKDYADKVSKDEGRPPRTGDRHISGAFLGWLLTDGMPAECLARKSIQVHNAFVNGTVDLEDADVPHLVELTGDLPERDGTATNYTCRFRIPMPEVPPGDTLLRHKIPISFNISKSRFQWGLKLQGCAFEGRVYLDEAEIGKDLTIRDSRFTHPRES